VAILFFAFLASGRPIAFLSLFTWAIPTPVVEATAGVTEATVHCLTPDPWSGEGKAAAFHGYAILATTTVTGPGLGRRIAKAIDRHIVRLPVMTFMCFNPRLGIHLVANGVAYDYLVCHECQKVQIYRGEELLAARELNGSMPFLEKVLELKQP
jgi:hypothetical protein